MTVAERIELSKRISVAIVDAIRDSKVEDEGAVLAGIGIAAGRVARVTKHPELAVRRLVTEFAHDVVQGTEL